MSKPSIDTIAVLERQIELLELLNELNVKEERSFCRVCSKIRQNIDSIIECVKTIQAGQRENYINNH